MIRRPPARAAPESAASLPHLPPVVISSRRSQIPHMGYVRLLHRRTTTASSATEAADRIAASAIRSVVGDPCSNRAFAACEGPRRSFAVSDRRTARTSPAPRATAQRRVADQRSALDQATCAPPGQGRALRLRVADGGRESASVTRREVARVCRHRSAPKFRTATRHACWQQILHDDRLHAGPVTMRRTRSACE
jgi:hypothetical protein